MHKTGTCLQYISTRMLTEMLNLEGSLEKQLEIWEISFTKFLTSIISWPVKYISYFYMSVL